MTTERQATTAASLPKPWSAERLRGWLATNLAESQFAGQRLLLVIPDPASALPLPAIFEPLFETLRPLVAALDVLAAVGDQPPLSDQQFCRWLGIHEQERMRLFFQTRFFNHDWDRSESLSTWGELSPAEVGSLTGGQLAAAIPIRMNSLLQQYDIVLTIDAVCPQGSGGFTGIQQTMLAGLGGPELISALEWLSMPFRRDSRDADSASDDSVRQLLSAGARWIPPVVWSLACVPHPDSRSEIGSLHFGEPLTTWQAASADAANWHIHTIPAAFERVIALIPERQADLWTAAAFIPLLESLVADGGTLMLVAPHISQLSISHRALFDAISLPGHPQPGFIAGTPQLTWQALVRHFLRQRLGIVERAGNLQESPRYRLVLATGLPAKVLQKLEVSGENPDDVLAAIASDAQTSPSQIVVQAGEDRYCLA